MRRDVRAVLLCGGGKGVRNADSSAERESIPAICEPPTPDVGAVTPNEGRAQALADIARNHHAALVRFLMARTGSQEEAREVAQEAYAKLLALDTQGPISFLAGYLWRVAANLAIDGRRRRAVRDRFAGVEGLGEGLEPSAERVVEARQRLAIVERAIDELPPRCLDAFRLRVLEGLRFEEVGREMRISDRMAKTYVARALQYLQSCLDAADAPGSRR